MSRTSSRCGSKNALWSSPVLPAENASLSPLFFEEEEEPCWPVGRYGKEEHEHQDGFQTSGFYGQSFPKKTPKRPVTAWPISPQSHSYPPHPSLFESCPSPKQTDSFFLSIVKHFFSLFRKKAYAIPPSSRYAHIQCNKK